jgi:hypothetical protein
MDITKNSVFTDYRENHNNSINANNIEFDTTTRYFLDNLETLKKLKKGDKLYIDSNQYLKIDDQSMFQGVWRYYNNVSRKDTIYMINKLYNDIETYINAIHYREIERLKKMHFTIFKVGPNISKLITHFIKELGDSIKGVENLKLTYEGDQDTIGEITKQANKAFTIMECFKKMI